MPVNPVPVVQVNATTKKALTEAVKTDPTSVKFIPVRTHVPTYVAYKVSADRLPEGAGVQVLGPNHKWSAVVVRKGDKLTVK